MVSELGGISSEQINCFCNHTFDRMKFKLYHFASAGKQSIVLPLCTDSNPLSMKRWNSAAAPLTKDY